MALARHTIKSLVNVGKISIRCSSGVTFVPNQADPSFGLFTSGSAFFVLHQKKRNFLTVEIDVIHSISLIQATENVNY